MHNLGYTEKPIFAKYRLCYNRFVIQRKTLIFMHGGCMNIITLRVARLKGESATLK